VPSVPRVTFVLVDVLHKDCCANSIVVDECLQPAHGCMGFVVQLCCWPVDSSCNNQQRPHLAPVLKAVPQMCDAACWSQPHILYMLDATLVFNSS
jgi:hypothetical protein